MKPRSRSSKKQLADQLEQRLSPNGGQLLYEQVRMSATEHENAKARFHIYRALSLMSSAMRERASDHKRSTDRLDTSRASAVSAVVKPAK